MLEVALWGSGNCQENENDNILQHGRFNQGQRLNVLAYIHLIVITNPNLDSDPSPNPKASSCSRWGKKIKNKLTNKRKKKKARKNKEIIRLTRIDHFHIQKSLALSNEV